MKFLIPVIALFGLFLVTFSNRQSVNEVDPAALKFIKRGLWYLQRGHVAMCTLLFVTPVDNNTTLLRSFYSDKTGHIGYIVLSDPVKKLYKEEYPLYGNKTGITLRVLYASDKVQVLTDDNHDPSPFFISPKSNFYTDEVKLPASGGVFCFTSMPYPSNLILEELRNGCDVWILEILLKRRPQNCPLYNDTEQLQG